jgi:hypothetical protein
MQEIEDMKEIDEDNVITHTVDSHISEKKRKGQFYTVNVDYICEGFEPPSKECISVIEPFAGKGDLLKWIQTINCKLSVEKYDIDPKCEGCVKQDTLNIIPDYAHKFVLTNPPYLARNKSSEKVLFDKYNTNDLYKCFILSLCNEDPDKRCEGGIIIIPAGFFFSPRLIDIDCRTKFMSMFSIQKVKYYEEQVFPDTPTTVVAIQFKKSDRVLTIQEVLWHFLPSETQKIFTMTQTNGYIIGGDIYSLPTSKSLAISRYVSGDVLKNNEFQTFLTLNALDSGKEDGRISLTYKKDYVYKAKDSSRSYATLIVKGKILTEAEQIRLSELFNTFLEKKRSEFKSLFLPQYRESKEYARKRIPFELAYQIVNYLIMYELST